MATAGIFCCEAASTRAGILIRLQTENCMVMQMHKTTINKHFLILRVSFEIVAVCFLQTADEFYQKPLN
jgi:hypothetical protein